MPSSCNGFYSHQGSIGECRFFHSLIFHTVWSLNIGLSERWQIIIINLHFPDYNDFLKKILYIRERERTSGTGGAKGEGEAHSWAGSLKWASFPGLRDHDLSRSLTLKGLSQIIMTFVIFLYPHWPFGFCELPIDIFAQDFCCFLGFWEFSWYTVLKVLYVSYFYIVCYVLLYAISE